MQNNIQNLKQLSAQIENNREKKRLQQLLDRQFYKTHFGPEETDEMIIEKILTEQEKKQSLLKDLNEQISIKKTIKESAFERERRNDLQNLDICQSTFLAEERAIQAKLLKEK